jgi:hypothetical protein
MRTLSAIVTCLLVIAFACGAAAEDGKVYGKGVSGEETIVVSELLAHPDKYVGETLRVQGTVVGTCAHRGCWINIASDKEGETVRVKVKDGVIVFPPEIVGETVIAEGVWTANELTLEQTKKVCEANAKKAGESFDPEAVTTCMTTYQLTGSGAVVLAKAE